MDLYVGNEKYMQYVGDLGASTIRFGTENLKALNLLHDVYLALVECMLSNVPLA